MLSNTVKCLGPEKDSGSLPSLQLSSNDGCWMLYLMVGLSEVLSLDLGNQGTWPKAPRLREVVACSDFTAPNRRDCCESVKGLLSPCFLRGCGEDS
jgi:hypothetical protein